MWIIDYRQKTVTQFRVKLLPVAKELVEHYSRLKLPENKVFSVKDRNSMNISLRLETVSKMLEHKHISTTQIYAKITNDKI